LIFAPCIHKSWMLKVRLNDSYALREPPIIL